MSSRKKIRVHELHYRPNRSPWPIRPEIWGQSSPDSQDQVRIGVSVYIRGADVEDGNCESLSRRATDPPRDRWSQGKIDRC